MSNGRVAGSGPGVPLRFRSGSCSSAMRDSSVLLLAGILPHATLEPPAVKPRLSSDHARRRAEVAAGKPISISLRTVIPGYTAQVGLITKVAGALRVPWLFLRTARG